MIAFSILAHQNIEILFDQLNNFKKFCPNSCFIVHINKASELFPRKEEIVRKLTSQCHVNDTSIVIGRHDLIQAHNENFLYCEREFGKSISHFCLHASNDMFVKSGVESYINSYECGFSQFDTHEKMEWTPYRRSKHDEQFKSICKEINVNNSKFSQPEGTFYSFDVFKEMLRIMNNHFDRTKIMSYMTKSETDTNNTLYAREEIYYPTIASHLTKNIGYPYLYSEVMTCNKSPEYATISIERIKKIIEGSLTEFDCSATRLVKSGNEKMYDKNNLYAVKRISFNFNDKVRTFIRGIQ